MIQLKSFKLKCSITNLYSDIKNETFREKKTYCGTVMHFEYVSEVDRLENI
jgi:hypothetical protein